MLATCLLSPPTLKFSKADSHAHFFGFYESRHRIDAAGPAEATGSAWNIDLRSLASSSGVRHSGSDLTDWPTGTGTHVVVQGSIAHQSQSRW